MARADAGPLAGRRIVITRAAEQAEEFVSRLAGLGAEAILLPMVRFVEPRDTTALDHAVAALADFDWLIFTSANAVRFFLLRWRALGGEPFPRALRVAAIGPATRAALKAEGLRASFMPRESRGTALAAELAPELRGQRVLLPRSDRAADDLPRALGAAGARVTEAVAYRTAAPETLDAAKLESLRGGAVDVVAFFSPSAFRNFALALGDESLRRIGARVAFAAVGPVTAEAIRNAGWSVAVEAPSATAQSFAAALERHFAPALPRPAPGKERARRKRGDEIRQKKARTR